MYMYIIVLKISILISQYIQYLVYTLKVQYNYTPLHPKH